MVAQETGFQRLGAQVFHLGTLLDRAIAPDSPGGEAVIDAEFSRIRRYYAGLRSQTSDCLTDVELARTLFNSASGHRSPRFQSATRRLDRAGESIESM